MSSTQEEQQAQPEEPIVIDCTDLIDDDDDVSTNDGPIVVGASAAVATIIDDDDADDVDEDFASDPSGKRNKFNSSSDSALAPRKVLVALEKDQASPFSFLFDLANIGCSMKKYLSTPLSELPPKLPGLMVCAISCSQFAPPTAAGDEGKKNKDEGQTGATPTRTTNPFEEKAEQSVINNLFTFRRAVAIDGTVDRNDEGAGAMTNLHKKITSLGVELDLFTAKSHQGSATVQRAVDVALGVQLLDLCGVLLQAPTVMMASSSSSSAPSSQQQEQEKSTHRHVALFSSDGDLEPAIQAAIERNPNLYLTVVYDSNSVAQRHIRWLATFCPTRLCSVSLSALMAAAQAKASALFSLQLKGATANNNNAAASASSPTDASSPQGGGAFTGQVILEIRRRDSKTTKEWIDRIEDAFLYSVKVDAADRIILKCNQDETLDDAELRELQRWLYDNYSKGSNMTKIRQLWVDHTRLLNTEDGFDSILSIVTECLPTLRELHISDVELTPKNFNDLAKAVIADRRLVYINCSCTPASLDPEEATVGLTVCDSFDERSCRMVQDSIGPGTVNARFVGPYRERRWGRSGGGGGRGSPPPYYPQTRGGTRGGRHVVEGEEEDDDDSSEQQAGDTSLYRRGGGRGRGAATRPSNGCFICGEVGHWSRECPTKRDGGPEGWRKNNENGGAGGGDDDDDGVQPVTATYNRGGRGGRGGGGGSRGAGGGRGRGRGGGRAAGAAADRAMDNMISHLVASGEEPEKDNNPPTDEDDDDNGRGSGHHHHKNHRGGDRGGGHNRPKRGGGHQYSDAAVSDPFHDKKNDDGSGRGRGGGGGRGHRARGSA